MKVCKPVRPSSSHHETCSAAARTLRMECSIGYSGSREYRDLQHHTKRQALGQISSLLLSYQNEKWRDLNVDFTFFFCLRHALQPLPEGTPGIGSDLFLYDVLRSR